MDPGSSVASKRLYNELRRTRARAAEIPGMDPGSNVLLLNKLNSELPRTHARACAAEISGIDPGSSVLLQNGSTTSFDGRARARRGNPGHRSRK